jgi:hypothetical protein
MTDSLLIHEEGRLFVWAARFRAKFILFFAQRCQLFLNRRDVLASGPGRYASLIEGVWQEVLRGLVLGIWPHALTPLSFVLEQHPQYSLSDTAGICYYVSGH